MEGHLAAPSPKRMRVGSGGGGLAGAMEDLTLPQLEQRAASVQSDLDAYVRAKTAELTQLHERIERVKEAKREERKRKRKRCGAAGCTNFAHKRGVCVRHGAKLKRCSVPGCEKKAQKGGTCARHAPGPKARCHREGCTLQAVAKGVCRRHAPRCKVEGCDKQVAIRGMCNRHDRETAGQAKGRENQARGDGVGVDQGEKSHGATSDRTDAMQRTAGNAT